jgi:hypothetical protein
MLGEPTANNLPMRGGDVFTNNYVVIYLFTVDVVEMKLRHKTFFMNVFN